MNDEKILLGLIDASVAQQYVSAGRAKVLYTDQIVPDGISIAVKKDSPQLVEALDNIIRQMIMDGFITHLEATYLYK